MRSPTIDAAILIGAQVNPRRCCPPTPADLWLLDAFAHLMGSERHGPRASTQWPDPMPQRKVDAA